MSTSSISKSSGVYRPRLLVKPLTLGVVKIKLDNKDKKFIQKLRDDLTDADPTIDGTLLNVEFGSIGWLMVSEQIYNAIKPFYEIKKVKSRIKVGR